jgi:RNA polymerase sigma-54 factor
MPDASMFLTTRLSQTASPAMQHAIRVLQMSSLDFAETVQQALDSNPFLEELETADAEPLLPADEPLSEFDAQLPDYLAGKHQGLPDDYDPHARLQAATSLHEHLRQQVWGQALSERERLAMILVIETLDDDGYLREPVTATAAAAGVELSADEIATAIARVQACDPAGVGARDLRECLSLQLQALDADAPARALAQAIVGEGLETLAQRNYAALAARFDVSQSSVTRAHRLIRSLDPKPGRRFDSSGAGYIEPDVLVTGEGDKLSVTINPAVLPRIGLNTRYARLLRNGHSLGHEELHRQLLEARWLLRHAQQRFDTLRRVAGAILHRQRQFFRDGATALKPLLLRQIADELDLHMSTISRATANKYMATPRGTFEFRYFFSRELATDSGGRCSAAAIKAAIREMVEGEALQRPQSDVVLAQRLKEQGIRISRRTVTKYRNAMRIVPADLRSGIVAG